MTLLLVYPGFGDENSEIKQGFVLKLLAKITSDVETRIFCHGIKKLDLLANIANLTVVYERGIIGQFLYRHITPSLVSSKYSHVMIVMDDMEVFDDFDIAKYLEKTAECDIISPSITSDSPHSHEYMLQKYARGIQNVPHIELFMYIMKTESYVRYYATFLDKFVSWLWYIDIMFPEKGFKCLLDYDTAVKHHYKGSSRTISALFESIHNCRRQLFPKRVVQLAGDESVRLALPDFEYFVLDTAEFIKEECTSKYLGKDLRQAYDQMYGVWTDSPDRDMIAIYLYLYKYGGVWISNTFALKNADMLRRTIATVGMTDTRLVLNHELIIAKPGDENLYAILAGGNIVTVETLAHLSQEILDNLK